MKFIVIFQFVILTCFYGCSQTTIISPPITNLAPKSITSEWYDQAVSRKVTLVLIDALPKIVDERYVLHKWDVDGTIKIFNQLDTSIIEDKKFISERIHLALTNERNKIPYKEKLDCLDTPFRYKFDFVVNKEKCDVVISPEIGYGHDKFRYLKFNISKAESWFVKIKYSQNWNNDCYTTEVVSKIVTYN